MRVHALSKTPRNAARRGPLLWSPRHPGIYIGPGLRLRARGPWVGCAVCRAHARRGDLRRRLPNHKDVETDLPASRGIAALPRGGKPPHPTVVKTVGKRGVQNAGESAFSKACLGVGREN